MVPTFFSFPGSRCVSSRWQGGGGVGGGGLPAAGGSWRQLEAWEGGVELRSGAFSGSRVPGGPPGELIELRQIVGIAEPGFLPRQVWSITRFFLLDFQHQHSLRKCMFTSTQSSFVSPVFGASAPSARHLRVSLCL